MVNSYRPSTLMEALEIIDSNTVTPIAGGTDLMVKKRNWAGTAPKFSKDILFIGHLKELNQIKIEKDQIRIGANCTISDVIEKDKIPDYIKMPLSQIASPGIRNIATLGGNICNASPAADSLPILYALNTKLILKSIDREREVNIEDFIQGPGENDLSGNELLKEIVIPKVDFNIVFYKKVGSRKANALSKVSFIGLSSIQHRRIKDIRISLGAVAPTVVRDKKIEERFIGMSELDIKGKVEELKILYADLVRPIDDQRASKEYRKKISLNLLEYFVQDILEF